MAKCVYSVYVGNTDIGADNLARFTEIRVDQGIGIATEAELDLPVATDNSGVWSGLEEAFTRPFVRVRIEVKIDDAGPQPLIDGPVVGTRYSMKAEPDQSRMTIVVQDDSVLLNRDEKVALFEDMAPSDIVSSLFGDAGLESDVDPAPDAGAALQRVVVQRGTAMNLLRDLARRYGMFVYVRPSEKVGSPSTGAFKKPVFDATDLPELLLLGTDRNVANFDVEFDALRPMTAKAGSIALADRSVLSSDASSASVQALGDNVVHSLIQPAVVLLTGTREEQSDIDAATTATVDLSSWAYTANGEVDSDRYSAVLQPYRLIHVRGIGGFLSGDYLIGRVNHVINDRTYKQHFSLHRNARSAGSSAATPSVPSGVM